MESTAVEASTNMTKSSDGKRSMDSTGSRAPPAQPAPVIEAVQHNNSSSSSVIVADQHHLLDFIFFLCTILDTVIVQPILFITSDDNVLSLPFYIS